MKQKFTTSTVLPLVLAGFLAFVARGQILSLWTGQSVSSPTDVSLTVIASASSSSDASSSSSASSTSSSSSSAATQSSTSSVRSDDPHGWHHYSEELTMERLIPLLRRRFRHPAAPVIPPVIVPPYYQPPTLPPTLEEELLNFGKDLQKNINTLFTWPFGTPEQVVETPLHFFPWGDFDGWTWEMTALAPEETKTPQHSAAGEPRWKWIQYVETFLGPRAEAVLWLFFLALIGALILFWRRLTDKAVNLLLWFHRNKDQNFACYEGPPLHPYGCHQE